MKYFSFFGEPIARYSNDGGKTWRTDGPMIGPGMIMQLITQDGGKVIYSAHAVEYEKTCDGCDGTGIRKQFRFQQDAAT